MQFLKTFGNLLKWFVLAFIYLYLLFQVLPVLLVAPGGLAFAGYLLGAILAALPLAAAVNFVKSKTTKE